MGILTRGEDKSSSSVGAWVLDYGMSEDVTDPLVI
jgi:hypothetical protein